VRRSIVVDASYGSWVRTISPRPQLRQGLMTVRWHPPPPNARMAVLYRRESRDSDWAVGALREKDFVTSWAVRSSGLQPLKRFSLAPAQRCVILPPDAAGDFGSSPPPACSPTQVLTLTHCCHCMMALHVRPSCNPTSTPASRRQRIPCTAAADACNRTASVGASLT